MVVLLGCSEQTYGPGVPVTKPSSPEDQIRPILENFAKTGQINSGVERVRDQLESLKTTNPAKAGPLLEDVKVLKSLSSPQEVQAKAKEILSKL
jgi:hypothetical protein